MSAREGKKLDLRQTNKESKKTQSQTHLKYKPVVKEWCFGIVFLVNTRAVIPTEEYLNSTLHWPRCTCTNSNWHRLHNNALLHTTEQWVVFSSKTRTVRSQPQPIKLHYDEVKKTACSRAVQPSDAWQHDLFRKSILNISVQCWKHLVESISSWNLAAGQNRPNIPIR